MTKEDIRTWEKDPITKKVMGCIEILKMEADIQVHDFLKPKVDRDFKDQMLQAAFYNAALSTTEEILDIPNQLILEVEEDGKLRMGGAE